MSFLVSLLFALLLNCSFLKANGQEASREFARLHREVTAWYYKYNPVTATANNVYLYNDLLESYNRSLHPVLKADGDSFLQRLHNITKVQLSLSAEKRSYDVLENMLKTFVDGYEWRDYHGLNPVSMMEGYQSYPYYIANIAPFDTVGDYENYLARLQRLPAVIDEYIELFREAIHQNRTYHNVSLELVYSQIDVFVNVSANSSEFYTPFRERLENKTTISSDIKESLQRRALTAVNSTLEAFRLLKDFLLTEYAPKTRKFYGVGGFERGKEYYTACLQWYLSDNSYTPEKVHEIGLQEVNRIAGKMQKIMDEASFNGTIAEYFQSLMNDSRFFLQTGEELLALYRSMLSDRVDPLLPVFFNNLPGLPIEIHPTSTDGIGGSYSAGSADGSRPGVFNANVWRPRDTPTFGMMALTLHEANPGHHLQISYGLVADVPEFMNIGTNYGSIVPFAIPSFPAFVEGWALYSEALGEEMPGVYQNTYELMGRYSSEMFRACRLVVDTGMHYYNWTREEAIGFMMNYTSDTRADIEIEINRYLTIPGQACSYKIGEIKIRELRQKAESALGSRFNLKAFHSVVLEGGAVPLSVLQTAVDEWINSLASSSTTPPPAGQSSALILQFSFLLMLATGFLHIVSH